MTMQQLLFEKEIKGTSACRKGERSFGFNSRMMECFIIRVIFCFLLLPFLTLSLANILLSLIRMAQMYKKTAVCTV